MADKYRLIDPEAGVRSLVSRYGFKTTLDALKKYYRGDYRKLCWFELFLKGRKGRKPPPYYARGLRSTGANQYTNSPKVGS